MKICIINPPIEDFYTTSIRRQPLGILYIISVLIENHEIEFINGQTPKKRQIPIPEKFNYLKDFINSNDGNYKFPFKKYSHFGMSFDEIKNKIKKSCADVFLISSLFTCYHEETEIIINYINNYHPAKIIVAGGYHAALHYKHFIENLKIDFVVTGEGENAVSRLLSALQNKTTFDKIPGIAYSKNNKLYKNENTYKKDLDQIPFPYRDFLLQRDFKAYGKKYTSIIFSRGCPNNCDFCTSKTMWGAYRSRSIDNIMEEFDICINKYKIDIFNFEDDNLFVSKSKSKNLLNRIIKYKNDHKLNFELTAMNGISIENIEPEFITLMKKAGFNEINISLVTHSEKLQKKQNRPFDTKKFMMIVKKSKNENIKIRAYFILGLPGQTKNEIMETISFLKNLKIDFYPSVYYNVFSGHEEWKCQRSSAFYNETKNLSRKDLICFFNKCRNLA